MKFTIHKKTLVKMLKVLSGGYVEKDAHLRIAAQDGRVTLTTEDLNEASYFLQYNAAKCYEGAEFFAFSDGVKIPPSSSLAFVQAGLNMHFQGQVSTKKQAA